MCGIFGYIGTQNKAAQIVFAGLRKLEYRGYDSWGVTVEAGGKLQVEKHAGKIGEAKIDHLPKSTFGLGHTRWATHGGITDTNAHPHLDCTKRIALVHNGIIENYEKIKEKLKKNGHKFISETDTEVAVHLIEEYYQRFSFLEAVRLAFFKLEGLNAIIAANSQNFEFVAAKTGSPLVVGFGQGENFLASDAPALLSSTRRVHFLEDGEFVQVTKNKVTLFEGKTGQVKKLKTQTLNWKIEEAERGNFPHFMLKEIFEQPKVLRNIVQNTDSVKTLAKIIPQAFGTYLVGCGTASYACLAGQYLFSKIAKMHINFAIGSEFGYLLDFLTPQSLVIALSQSGETIDIIEAVTKAQAKGAKIVAMVNNLGSTLYRLSDYKILLGAGPEKAVASTKAFTAKLGILTLLAFALAGKIEEGKKLFKKGILASEKIFLPKNLAKIKKLAAKIYKKDHLYVIGRGLSYPAALEATLKIKEISYIHAEGFASGELKHGVIALVEKGTPCIVFAPNDETYGAVISGAREMKARGGFIIGISSSKNSVFDYFLPVGDCGPVSLIPQVIVAQLFAYFLATKRGLDPDKPRNLAKSVTVK